MRSFSVWIFWSRLSQISYKIAAMPIDSSWSELGDNIEQIRTTVTVPHTLHFHFTIQKWKILFFWSWVWGAGDVWVMQECKQCCAHQQSGESGIDTCHIFGLTIEVTAEMQLKRLKRKWTSKSNITNKNATLVKLKSRRQPSNIVVRVDVDRKAWFPSNDEIVGATCSKAFEHSTQKSVFKINCRDTRQKGTVWENGWETIRVKMGALKNNLKPTCLIWNRFGMIDAKPDICSILGHLASELKTVSKMSEQRKCCHFINLSIDHLKILFGDNFVNWWKVNGLALNWIDGQWIVMILNWKKRWFSHQYHLPLSDVVIRIWSDMQSLAKVHFHRGIKIENTKNCFPVSNTFSVSRPS